MRVAVSGDQAAFGQLVERHQTPVRRFLRRLVAGDVSAADDLAQDTFIIAYQKMHTWKGTAQLTTWLHTIAYRLFLDHVRKHSRTSVMARVAAERSRRARGSPASSAERPAACSRVTRDASAWVLATEEEGGVLPVP